MHDSYNKKRKDFANDDDYNQYLEQIEDKSIPPFASLYLHSIVSHRWH